MENVAHGKIAKGNFGKIIEGHFNNEFDQISDVINLMVEEIEAYMSDKEYTERKAYEAGLDKLRAIAAKKTGISGTNFASKIQKNYLPAGNVLKKAFSDYSVIYKPRDVVGGDIFWVKEFEEGTVLCVCDCTGHGTAGALLSMFVVSTLEESVTEQNCKDTAEIVWLLEQSFKNANNGKADAGDADGNNMEGCDIAVLFIARNKSVTLSSGRINIFICNGRKVWRHNGQKIFIGDGKINSKEAIKTVNIPAGAGKFYIASDGLFDQPGGASSEPFGFTEFEKIILDNHNKPQKTINEKIWAAFEKYRGGEQRLDDVELIAFKL
jgi:serine phosphatase RsbU (regulator of sigma subunit)